MEIKVFKWVIKLGVSKRTVSWGSKFKSIDIADLPKPVFSKKADQEYANRSEIMVITKMAAKHDWVMSLCQSLTSMVQFSRGNAKMNVYFTKSGFYSIATTITHPTKGRNQLYRKHINKLELEKIFAKPRYHTGKGYYKK